MRRTDGTIAGSRIKGEQWELAIRGKTIYFPLCEYEAMRDFKDEVSGLDKEAPLPNHVDFYRHTTTERVRPINRRSTVLDTLDWYEQSGYVTKGRAAAFRGVRNHQATAEFAKLSMARCNAITIDEWVVHLFDLGYSDSSVSAAFETVHRVFRKLRDAGCTAIWTLDRRVRKGEPGRNPQAVGGGPGSRADQELETVDHPTSGRGSNEVRIGQRPGHLRAPGLHGLRISEAIWGQAGDIDLEDRTVLVRGTKTGSALRIVPLPSFVFEFLDAASELLWGKPLAELSDDERQQRWCTLDVNTWRTHFYAAQAACDIPEPKRYWPHALRRWFLNQVGDLDEVELRAISVFAGHEVAGSVLKAGASLITFGCYVRDLRRGLRQLADVWDDVVVTDVGLLIPHDGPAYAPTRPMPGTVTLQQAAVITGEEPSLMRFMALDGRFQTARKERIQDWRATREIWIIDEEEVRQFASHQKEFMARVASVSELAKRYGVCHQTILDVVQRCQVPHQKIVRRGKQVHAIDRAPFDTAAVEMGLDRVANYMLRHHVAAELDCPRKEVDWLIAHRRLSVERFPFDTRGTRWITKESVEKEKARRSKHRIEDGPCLTAAEAAELLGCTRATVYHLRRQGVLSTVTDAKNRVVTPQAEIHAMLDRQRTHVQVNEAAALLDGSRGIVERYIKLGLLHPVLARGPGTRMIRMIARDEIDQVRQSSAYLDRRRRPGPRNLRRPAGQTAIRKLSRRAESA